MYAIDCTECPLHTTVTGLDTVLDFEDIHQVTFGDEHRFEFVRITEPNRTVSQ